MFKNRKRKQKLLTEEEIKEKFKDVDLEKADVPAMFLAALLVFLPAVLLLLFAVYGIMWLIFIK